MEFTGKTVKEATEAGLAELGLKAEEAEIVVKEEPVKGLFGRLKGQAVVDITPKQIEEAKEEKKEEKKEKTEKKKGADKTQKKAVKEDDKCAEAEFLKKVLEYLKIPAETELRYDNEKEILTLITDSSSSVIGYRGEVLDALQTLTGAIANIGNKVYRKVVVDCENYRDRREETLIKLAKRLEEKATDMRREVHLEPMSPFERRIIHTALAESTTVTTRSEGKEPNRFVIIVPNDLDEFSRPYNAGMNRGSSQKKNGGFSGESRKRDFSGKGDRRGSHDRRGSERRMSGFSEEKRKSSFGFGTYLGNSFKDKD